MLECVCDVWSSEHALQVDLALDADGGDVTHLKLHRRNGQNRELNQLALVHQVTCEISNFSHPLQHILVLFLCD